VAVVLGHAGGTQDADAAGSGHAQQALGVVGVAGDDLQAAVRIAGHHVEQRLELGVVGQPAGHEVAGAVGVEEVGRQAERPVGEGVVEGDHHQAALLLGGGALPRVSAHGVPAQSVVTGVGEQGGGGGAARGDGVVLRPRPPPPRHVALEQRERQLLDEAQEIGDGVLHVLADRSHA
jgi:hypothetical protein